MNAMLEPIENGSLSDVFVNRFESLILSGAFAIGEKLPSERELAVRLCVSRPVVHEGLIELEHMGLVKMIPRVGTVVSDYRREGSLALLNSLVKFKGKNLDSRILENILDMRTLFEVEIAGQAAKNRSKQSLRDLEQALLNERNADRGDARLLAELDFDFHHKLTIASENMVYPLFLNSFKPLSINMSTKFFSDENVVNFVLGLHARLLDAIKKRRQGEAKKTMKTLLDHGRKILLEMIETDKEAQNG